MKKQPFILLFMIIGLFNQLFASNDDLVNKKVEQLKKLLTQCTEQLEKQKETLKLYQNGELTEYTKKFIAKLDYEILKKKLQKIYKSPYERQIKIIENQITKINESLNQLDSNPKKTLFQKYFSSTKVKAQQEIAQESQGLSTKTKLLIGGIITVGALIGTAWYLGYDLDWFKSKIEGAANYITARATSLFPSDMSIPEGLTRQARMILADEQFHDIQASRLINQANLKLSVDQVSPFLRKLTQSDQADFDQIATELAKQTMIQDSSLSLEEQATLRQFLEGSQQNIDASLTSKFNSLKNVINSNLKQNNISLNTRKEFITSLLVQEDESKNIGEIVDTIGEKKLDPTQSAQLNEFISQKDDKKLSNALDKIGIQEDEKKTFINNYQEAATEQFLDLTTNAQSPIEQKARQTFNHLQALANDPNLDEASRKIFKTQLFNFMIENENSLSNEQMKNFNIYDNISIFMKNKLSGCSMYARDYNDKIKKILLSLSKEELHEIKSYSISSNDVPILNIVKKKLPNQKLSEIQFFKLDDELQRVNIIDGKITPYGASSQISNAKEDVIKGIKEILSEQPPFPNLTQDGSDILTSISSLFGAASTPLEIPQK